MLFRSSSNFHLRMAENLSVSWGEYQNNICKGLGALQQRGEFVDMTLAADGHHVKVHQMVLSLVSPFIKNLISSANCPHPVIFLNRVSLHTMEAILEYAYTGEVVVRKDQIGEFLEACKDLHIKGLENVLQNMQTSTRNTFTEIVPNEPEDKNPNERKRKMSHREKSCAEVSTYDDDFQTEDAIEDVTEEVQDSSALPDLSVISTSEKTPNESARSVKKAKSAPVDKDIPLQYSVSNQGNLQLVLNRFLYAMRHTRKNDERFWRCISQQTTSCPAIVTTFEGKIKERSFPHNHAFHDAQILKRVKRSNLFTSLADVEEAAAATKRNKGQADLLKQAFDNL